MSEIERNYKEEMVKENTPDRPQSFYRYLLLLGIIATAYFITARLSLLLACPGTNASPVWPPSGIALGFMVLFGYRIWPGIFIGSYGANLLLLLENPGDPWLIGIIACIAGLGNVLEAIAARYAIKRFNNGLMMCERPRQVFAFFLISAAACGIAATIGPIAVCLSKLASWQVFPKFWLTWWTGDLVGILVITPLLLKWNTKDGKRHSRQEFALRIAALLLLVCLSFLIFLDPVQAARSALMPYMTIPVLLWIAFRFGQKEAIVGVFIVAALTTWGTIHGTGLFARAGMNIALLQMQGFIAVIAVTTLVLTAAIKERNSYHKQLQDSLAKVIGGYIPICANCKKIRKADNEWDTVEQYLHTHSTAELTHSICPTCAKKLYPEYEYRADPPRG